MMIRKMQLMTLVVLIAFFTNIMIATAMSRTIEAAYAWKIWAIAVTGAPPNASVNVKPMGDDSVVYNVKTDAKGTGQVQVKQINTPCTQVFIDKLPQNLHINYPPDWINHLVRHGTGDTFQPGVSGRFTLCVDVAKGTYVLLNTNDFNDFNDKNTIPDAKPVPATTSVPATGNVPANSSSADTKIPANSGSKDTNDLMAGLFNTVGAAASGDSITYHSQMLLFKLSVATKLFGSALTDVARAWNMDADKIAAVDLAAKKAREKPDDASAQAEYLESTKRLNDQVKDRVEQAEKNNEQASDALKAAIRNAEIQKGLAWLINASAVPDAVILVNDAYNVVNDPDVSWIVKIFRGGQVLYTAYSIKKTVSEQSDLLTIYGDYMDKFRATQGISKPDDDEIRQAGKDLAKG
ncbi:MAG: hypothetical protein WCV63_10655 [Negativicutes bacterium]|jgi:hypothetical protein